MICDFHIEFPEDFEVLRDDTNDLPVTRVLLNSSCYAVYTIVIPDEHLDDFIHQLLISYMKAKTKKAECQWQDIEF